MRISDWSSDVCSSDLLRDRVAGHHRVVVQEPKRRIGRRVRRYCWHRSTTPITCRAVPGSPASCRESMADGLSAGIPCESKHRASSGEELIFFYFNRSAEHTSELPSLMRTSYDVFCLKKQNNKPHR